MSPLPHFSLLTAEAVEATGTIEVVAPFDRRAIAEIETCGEAGAEQVLESAYQLFRDRKAWLSVAQRIEILTRTVALMEARSEELAIEAAREGGKPLVDSQVEVVRAIDSLRICIDTLRTDSGEVIPMGINAASAGKLAFSSAEPIGVVLALSAFNHPLNLIAHQVGPAVAAGCPVIVKPAQETPLSCFRLVEMLHQAGLPKGWCQALIPDQRAVTTKLVGDSRVAFLSFIGSAKVGWMLRSQLAPGTRCALEHGGAAPVVVAEDADLDLAIPKLTKGGFYHAGQVCVSVQRVFAERSIAREVAERLAAAAAELSVGDPTLEGVDIGPLIRPAEVTRLTQWVDEAVSEGAERMGSRAAATETTYPCTVLYDPSPDSKVSREEIFGPVVSVYPYDDLDAAIEQANALPWSFQAAVFTQSMERARAVAGKFDASAVMINDHTAFRVDWMPFAGLRQSGLGVGGIPYTIRDMQVQKMVVM